MTAAHAVLVASATMPPAEERLLHAWDVRQALIAAIVARGAYDDAHNHSHDLLELQYEADGMIVDAETSSPRAALAKAWVAWAYNSGPIYSEWEREVYGHVLAADFAWLQSERDDLGYDGETMLAIVTALRGLAGEA